MILIYTFHNFLIYPLIRHLKNHYVIIIHFLFFGKDTLLIDNISIVTMGWNRLTRNYYIKLKKCHLVNNIIIFLNVSTFYNNY